MLRILDSETMTTAEVARRLVTLCRRGAWEQALDELFHSNATSIEPEGAMSGITTGIANIQKKGQVWSRMVKEFHGVEVSEPLVAGEHIVMKMVSDITFHDGGRQQSEEICLYHVKAGKILTEQFFYEPPTV